MLVHSDAFGGGWLGVGGTSSKGESSGSCRREKRGVFGAHVGMPALGVSALSTGAPGWAPVPSMTRLVSKTIPYLHPPRLISHPTPSWDPQEQDPPQEERTSCRGPCRGDSSSGGTLQHHAGEGAKPYEGSSSGTGGGSSRPSPAQRQEKVNPSPTLPAALGKAEEAPAAPARGSSAPRVI